MCGIVGAIGTISLEYRHKRLVETLGHRGPDAQGLEELTLGGKRVIMGHTRLAIVELSEAGAQPIYSRDGRWLVVYNGEIYNHMDLRETLPGPFRGRSDTETLVECLSLWGFHKTICKLNGMFGFAACDLQSHLLYIARDPFGIKPVYYHVGSGGICFSSEVRALKAISGLNPGLDQNALHSFLALRFTPSPQTLFDGIHRLPPGCALEYDPCNGSLKKLRYIKPTTRRFSGSQAEAVSAYHDVLSKAVNRQLLADVPLGVLLSGGVDSAIIAALARDSGADVTAFTVGFGDNYEECEITPAAHTAKVLDMHHQHIQVDSQSCWDAIAPAIAHIEEPLGTTSILPMWHLSTLAGSQVKAVLTGQGSDEPWGGYRRYQGVLLAQWLPKTSLWRSAWRLLEPLLGNMEALERALRSFSQKEEVDRFMEAYALFTTASREDLANGPAAKDLSAPVRDWLNWADYECALSSVERMMRIDCRMNLADDLLLYTDKVSMAHSLEARVPMIDMEVIDFIDALPRPYRMRWRQTKIVHKQMAKRYLPAEIVDRPKLGFQVPVGTWLRGPWKEPARELLLESSKFRNIVDPLVVLQLFEEHQNGKADRQRQIFALICLATWANQNL